MRDKGKSTNGLMRHIRNYHKIDINGSKQKQELLNMGYYHGYKAYRFIKDTENIQPYENFSEIQAIYDFDNDLKAMLYPILMKIETALKNRTIDILTRDRNPNIEYIYDNFLNSYKDYSIKKSTKYRENKINFKSRMTSTIAYNYKNTIVIQHFINKGEPIPLWAYFEVTTLGEFGDFISCLNKDIRIKLLKEINFYNSGVDLDGKNLKTIIFLINDLRNAVMHNSVIYDCRFKKSNSNSKTNQQISNLTNISNIDFESIIDYIILFIVLQSKLSTANKTELRRELRNFINLKEILYNEIPNDTFNSFFHTDNNRKLNELNVSVKLDWGK